MGGNAKRKLRLTRDQVRRALWSVYYHAIYLPRLGPSLLQRLDVDEDVRARIVPVPLENALATILSPFDEHDAIRRQRALYQLAAAGLANRARVDGIIASTPGVLRPGIEAVQGQLDRLGASLGVDMKALEEVPMRETTRVLDHLVQPPSGACRVKKTRCVSTYDAFERTVTVVAVAQVERPLDELRRPLDPRCWDDCSHVFLETTPVDPGPGKGGSTIGSGASRYHRVSRKEPEGDPWSGLLYEKVTAGGWEYENILNIDYRPTAMEIFMTYSLHDRISPITGGLVVNEGHARAIPIAAKPGWSEVTVVKTVWFDDMTGGGGPADLGELPNWLATGILCMWLDEAGQQGVCC